MRDAWIAGDGLEAFLRRCRPPEKISSVNQRARCAFACETSVFRIEFNTHRTPMGDEELTVAAGRVEQPVIRRCDNPFHQTPRHIGGREILTEMFAAVAHEI